MLREELVEGYVRGDITRRTFVRRLTAAGVGLAAAMSYAQLLRPQDAHAAPGESDLYETDLYAEEEAKLPPDVITEAPAQITHAGAVGNAQVDPNLQETRVWFEAGPPGGPYTGSAQAVVAGDGDRRLTLALPALSPNTSYVVRAVAANRSGTTAGEFVAFATLVAPAPPPEPVAQAAQVPAPDKRGPFVNPKRTSLALRSVLKSGVIPVQVTADEDATADLTASLSVPVRGVRAAASRTRKVKVAAVKASVRGGRTTTAKLKITRAGKRELKRRKAATLALEIVASDRSRNRSVLRSTIRLK